MVVLECDGSGEAASLRDAAGEATTTLSAGNDAPKRLSEAEVELTVLMPCLDESETIGVCIEKAQLYFERAGINGEILVADNGSRDGSQAIAAQLGARVIDVPERGYGAALLGGIEAARGPFIVMGDADDSYDFGSLNPFLEALRDGADIVIGNRFKGGIAPGAMPILHRYLGNPVLSYLGRRLFRIEVGDFHCGLRGFSKEAVTRLDLRSQGMEFASEMIVKAAIRNLRIAEVPTTLSPDGRSRRPHLKTWRDGWRHLRFLLLHCPRWLFLYPGLALLATGLCMSAILATGTRQITPTLGLGIHSLVAACFMILIGIQVIVFGALARRHAAIEGVLPPPENWDRLILGLNLERTLQIGLVLFLLGISGCVWSFVYWAGTGFGQIEYPVVLNVLVLSLTSVTAAIQLAFSGFLASVFELRSRK